MRYGDYDCYDTLPELAFQRRDRYSMTLEGGGKGGGGGGQAPSPDPNIGKAALQQAQVAQQQEQLASQEYNTFMTQIYPELQSQAQAQTANSNQITAANLKSMQQQQALTDNYSNRITGVLEPLQDSIVAQAKDYNTEGNIQQQQSLAEGDVSHAYDAQRTQMAQNRAAYGIDPTSGAATSQNQTLGVQQAADTAAAGTRARQAAVQLGWAKNLDAANMLQGLPSNQTSSLAAGTAAGNSALASGQTGFSNTLATSGAMNSATGTAQQGYAGAQQGWGSVGNLGLGTYQGQISAYNAQQQANATSSAGWGGAIGSAIGAYAALSDRRAKENIKEVGATKSGLPIYTYNYKGDPIKLRQMGVMAQDVKKAIPTAVIKTPSGLMAVDYSKVN